jgi:hypothetical protein
MAGLAVQAAVVAVVTTLAPLRVERPQAVAQVTLGAVSPILVPPRAVVVVVPTLREVTEQAG